MLFERHAPTIYNYCFRRVGSWAVAEDLVSIVFLEAWRRVDKKLPSGKELRVALWHCHERLAPPSLRASVRGALARFSAGFGAALATKPTNSSTTKLMGRGLAGSPLAAVVGSPEI